MSAVQLDLPDGLAVVDADDPLLVEVEGVAPALQQWWDQLRAARSSAGAALVAVQTGAVTPLSLVAHLGPLPAGADDVVVQGLRAMALARTSPTGEVSVLDLPAGAAVASADVVGAGAQAVVQLPLPRVGELLTLTVAAADQELVAECAALAAAVAARVQVGEDGPRG
jgi:hypothetical protein